MLHPGAHIDRYIAEYLLGRGGMAEVWAVRHKVLGTHRALKVLSVRGDGVIDRLLEEGRVQARLEHAHVLPVLDVVEVEGAPALVLPLVVGTALDEALTRVRLSVDEVASVAAGVTSGLAHAHLHGVAHRDIKPANVLLALQGERLVPRVADFGLAKALDPGMQGPTRSGAMMGTPGYAAPEQILDAASADHRADWWAVGVMLYELLAGRRPFDGRSLRELLAQQRQRDYPPLASLAPEADPGWSVLISELLEPMPRDRLADGAEVLARLRALAPGSEPVLTSGALVDAVREVVASRATHAARESARTTAASTLASAGDPLPHHHLPAERDTFVGREADLAELEERLESGARLLTVLGTGGTGKTRLVLHYGWSTLERWPGGVWFCDLTDATTLDGIAHAVGRALDVPLGRDPVEQLGHAIAGHGECLVILDNFEQVAAHARDTLGRWLDRADQARFVVTSQAVLGLRGESSLSLDPLDVLSAVELFAARAADAKRGFSLSDEERPTVVDLVQLLDGLPLAIELAAARVVILTPDKILSRMSDRFRLLSSGSSTRGRQATLRGAIDWSWELLTKAEQSGLAQLSAFDGGFTLDSAEAVLDLSPFPEAPWPMDIVQALVGKSLVRSVEGDRFDLLVSIHEYATEKLAQPGAYEGSGPEAARATWERHEAHYAAHGDDAAIEALSTHGGVERRRALYAEIGNLVSACRRARLGSGATAVALLRATWEALRMRGPLAPAVTLAQEVLAMPSLDDTERARACLVASRACDLTGRMDEALAHVERGLDLCRTRGDRAMEGRALWDLGIIHLSQGQLGDARARFGEALAVVRATGDRRFEARVNNSLGVALAIGGELDHAGEHFEAARALASELGDVVVEGAVLGNLGELALIQDRLDEAEGFLEAALVANTRSGDLRSRGISLGNLGVLRRRQARLDEARIALGEGERLLRELGNLRQVGILRTRSGVVEHGAGHPEAARAALMDATAIADRLGCGPDTELGKSLERLRSLLQPPG